jgi:agmatine deiminase
VKRLASIGTMFMSGETSPVAGPASAGSRAAWQGTRPVGKTRPPARIAALPHRGDTRAATTSGQPLVTNPSPAAAGFHMPAEWAPHAGTWMGWPCRKDLWGAGLAAAQHAYADVARAIARFETVTMLANAGDLAAAHAACGPGIDIVALPMDDSWLRDSGPSFVVNGNGETAGIAWGFNAWGEKFPPWDKDARVAGLMLARLGMRAFTTDFILEGGSIHVDGQGTVLTTEQCLLNPNRNPGHKRGDIETQLNSWLGAHTIIWLGEGLENDHTDGHIDDIACFVRPGVVLAAVCADRGDANYAPLAENLRRLKNARDAQGRALEIIEMPLPGKREIAGVGRLAASYVNFYIANGGIIAPSFDDPRDAEAERILQAAFPDRDVVMVPCLPVVAGGGSVHCITQQQAAGRPAPRISP